MRLRPLLVGLAALALSSANLLYSQATARLTGTVTDNTNAVVAGVEITITNTGTGVERKTLTSEQGDYTVPGARRLPHVCAKRGL